MAILLQPAERCIASPPHMKTALCIVLFVLSVYVHMGCFVAEDAASE